MYLPRFPWRRGHDEGSGEKASTELIPAGTTSRRLPSTNLVPEKSRSSRTPRNRHRQMGKACLAHKGEVGKRPTGTFG